MSISIHSRSVPIGKLSGGSFGVNLAKHIDRDKNNVKQVMQNTDSDIYPDMTQYNIRFEDMVNINQNISNTTKKAMDVLKMIQAKRSDKYDALLSGDAAKDELKQINREIKKRQKRITRAKGKSTYQATIDRENPEIDRLQSQKKSLQKDIKAGRGNTKLAKLYKKFDPRTGVAAFTNITLGHDTMLACGWQFHKPNSDDLKNHTYETFTDVDGNSVNYTRPFNPKEQKDYDEKHNANGFERLSMAYVLAFKSISDNPNKYGDVISSGIHFDESSPHLDILTLNVGYDLHGNPKGHVGAKDNGTNDDLLLVRGRTYLDGTSINNGRCKGWKSKTQDEFASDFEKSFNSHFKNPLTPLIKHKYGFKRGIKKQASADKVKHMHANIRTKSSLATSLAASAAAQSTAISKAADEFEQSKAAYKSSVAADAKSSASSVYAQSSARLSMSSQAMSMSAITLANYSADLSVASSALSNKADSVAAMTIQLSDFINTMGYGGTGNVDDFIGSFASQIGNMTESQLHKVSSAASAVQSHSKSRTLNGALDDLLNQGDTPTFADNLSGDVDKRLYQDNHADKNAGTVGVDMTKRASK